ncbi:MAG: PAS domain S-box protein [Rhodomicrobium sp.]
MSDKFEPASSAAHKGSPESPVVRGEFHQENEANARLREIVDNAVDGIITIDDRGSISSLNPAAQRLFGYSPEELIGQNVKILMPEPYHSEHDRYLRNYRETGERKIIGIGREVSGRRKDGTVFPLDLSVSEVRRGGQRIFTGIVRDISERKRVEGERQKYVSLVENNSDFIAMASLSWEMLYINKAGRDLIGIDQNRVTEIELHDVWNEGAVPAVLKEAIPNLVKGGSVRFQGKLKHFVTCQAIDVDCNIFGILDPQTNQTLAIACSLRDNREQKQREQAVRDSEARLRAILDTAVDGIITINERGTIERLNPAALKIFGYTTEELTGQNVKMLMPEPYHREHDQYLRNYRNTGQHKIIGIGREVAGRRKDGSVFPLDLSVSEVPLGNCRLFTGIIRDITERKQVERHRSLLVAELSHRVKNTLATVISIARQTFSREQPYAEALAAFDGRVRALAHTHSRLAERNWSEVALAALISSEMSPYLNAEGTNIAAQGPEIMLNPKCAISLGMAFHELATNAAKHGALSQQGGSVEIAWDIIRQQDNQLRIRWGERGGPQVAVPTRSGFGRLLLERGLAHELQGKVQLEFAREGLRCTIVFPLNGNSVQGEEAGGGI